MEPVKILRIITRLNIGGPAIHTLLLSTGIDPKRYTTRLVAGRLEDKEGDMSYLYDKANIDLYIINQLHRQINLLDDLVVFFRLYLLMRRYSPYIVHTHTAKAGVLGRVAAFFARVPVRIHTFHGHIFQGYFSPIKTRIFIYIERILDYFTNHFVTISPIIKDELVRFKIAPPGKINIIRLGIDLDRFLSLPYKRERSSLNIGIVGRLVRVKNHFLFLDMAKLVIQRIKQVRFIIVGDGPLRNRVELYSERLGISSYIEFWGWREDLDVVYYNLDIVALSSLNEGTPVSLIEAMASGCVVVSTDVGGVRELIRSTEGNRQRDRHLKRGFRQEDTGILVQSGNTFGFASAIEFLITNPQVRLEMQRSAREYVRERFSHRRLIKDTERLYDEILEGCRAA